MNFPVWEIPWLGGELPRAAIGYLLSLATHFVAGSSLLMVLLEHRAQREGHQPLLSFLQDWSRFTLLMTAILGAGLSAALWLVLGVTRPWSVFALARSLFWIWGIVWALGFTGLAGTLLYYSGWGVTPPRHHLAAGWVVAASSWLSLFALNGIFAFLVSPGAWPRTGQLSDGFFNVTFNPSLLIHGGLALGLGGLFPLVAATETEPAKLRALLVRTSAAFACVGFLALLTGEAWHAAVLPPAARSALQASAVPPLAVLVGTIAVAAVISAFAAAGPLARPEGAARPQALLLLALGLVVTASSSWLWQAARAPHVVAGWLEENGLDPREIPAVRSGGFLPRARWAVVRSTADPRRAGAELYRLQCAACHTLGGYRGLAGLTRGWDAETLARQLERLPDLRGAMPPFAGTAAERRALAGWLAALGKPR